MSWRCGISTEGGTGFARSRQRSGHGSGRSCVPPQQVVGSMAVFVAVLRCTSCGGLPHSAAEHLTLLWLQQELTPSPHWQLLVVTCIDNSVPTGTLKSRRHAQQLLLIGGVGLQGRQVWQAADRRHPLPPCLQSCSPRQHNLARQMEELTAEAMGVSNKKTYTRSPTAPGDAVSCRTSWRVS
eukprot:GHRQ01026891.1.p1 GENE.GHRQ01026891.1~~GHRQ01026891.1.p1  ORF type:complete len:182 (-),score=29.00 GHRQ01026891.1:72-617(-)